MKAILSKEQYRKLKRSPKKLKIYGFIREDEDLVNVIHIGRSELSFPPKIGEVGGKEGNLPLHVTVNEDAKFSYRNSQGLTEVKVEVVDLDDSFNRTPFPRKLLDKLNQSCVLIFGLGSGGGRLATCLVRDNVGYLKLVDPKEFSIENLRRHECDLSDLGRYKVHAVREKVKRISPQTKVESFPSDPFQWKNKLDGLFRGVDLVIGATDKLEVQLQINREAWIRGVPAVFGGCYEEARGGEVLFTLPEEGTPCLECLRGSIKQPEVLGSIDYSLAEGPEDYEGEPGLYAAISLVTDIEEQIALAVLLRENQAKLSQLVKQGVNMLLVGGALAKDFYLFKRPFHIAFARFQSDSKCSTCHPKSLSDEERRRVGKDQIAKEEIPEELKEFL